MNLTNAIKINNKGYTLVELLAVIVIIGIVFAITSYIVKGTAATTLTQIEETSNNQIFASARAYIIETNKSFNSNNYVCVTIQELIDYGYVKNINNIDKTIKITRNNQTKAIEEIKYVDNCN